MRSTAAAAKVSRSWLYVLRDPARSPLGLCEDHEKLYRRAGRPGGARLPSNWGRWFERRGVPVSVSCDDEPAFRRWCHQVQPAPRPGQISLHGMRPLIKAELKWRLPGSGRLMHARV